ARYIANSFAGSLDVLNSLSRRTLRSFADFFIVGQPFRFGSQTVSATRHRLSATLCSFTRRASTFTHKIRDREFFVELTGFSARPLLPFVQLIFVICHPVLAMQVLNFHRLVRHPPPLSSTSAAPSSPPGRGRFAWLRTMRRPPPSGYPQQFARR